MGGLSKFAVDYHLRYHRRPAWEGRQTQFAEAPEEQVREAYDAYNAGASMVHIHRRNPENPMQMFLEVGRICRDQYHGTCQMSDLIINNTCLGGRMLNEETGTIGDRMLASIPAKPEVASLDIHCFCEDMPMKARKAPLFGRDEDAILKFHYSISPDTAKYVAQLMDEQGIKPEFEMFDIADVKYLNRLAKDGTAKNAVLGIHAV